MTRAALFPSPEVVAEADRLHSAGLSWTQIAITLGWSSRILRLAVERLRERAGRRAVPEGSP